METLLFALVAVVLFVAVAQVGRVETEPVRVRKLREELDRIGYHPLG